MENAELSDSQTLCDQPTGPAEALSLELSTYQVAVLSTLFDQNDARKLPVLAEQWGVRARTPALGLANDAS